MFIILYLSHTLSYTVPRTMGIQSKNIINAFTRLAYLERIIDGLEPARQLDFEAIYKRWTQADFFKQLREMGYISVSYNGTPQKEYIPSALDANRHQVIALSTFLASCYADSDAVVECPHELGDMFRATFVRTGDNTIYYTTEGGSNVLFVFDKNRPSRF